MTELHKRTIIRALSYRIVALLITAVYYIMERLWLKINWGKN